MMLPDVVLFEAMDLYDTTSLWVTNGTATGTFELTSSGGPPVKGQALITGEATYGFAPSPAVSLDLTVFNNQVLFAGRIGPGGIGPFELWTTNGTAAGTVALTPVAGASSAGLFTAAVTPGFTVFGNEVLFRGIDRSGASGLWTTDGTAAGTNEITGINGVAATGINPTDITVFNDKALFNGADAAGALGLWTTDGTASGTTEVAVNGAASAGVNPTDMTVFNGEVLFNGFDNGGASGLWVTDGTTAGTHELTGIAQAPTTGSGLNPSNMTVFEGRVFFTGTDASGLSGLWVTDGTAGGTQELVAEAAGGGGAKDPLGLNPSDLTVFNGEIFFSGFDQDGRRQLWKTDGTAGGAQMLAPAAESTVYGLKPSSLEVYDNQLLFSGLNSKGLQGLWTSDGTAAGTVEITPSSGTWAYGLNPVDLTALAPTPTTALTPTISGTVSGQTTTSEAPVKPFAHVTIGDASVGATDTLTITVAGAGGTLSDGVGFSGLTGAGAGVYTLSGTAAAITTELDALIFTPKAGAPNTTSTTTFTLSDQSSAGGAPVVDSMTSVIDSDPAVAPTVAGTVSGQTTRSEAPVSPFAHVTIGDANVGATDTLTITVGGGGGTLTDGAGFSGLTRTGAGVYTLSGAAAAITSELEALIFIPYPAGPGASAASTFTLSDVSSAGGAPAVDSTTTVIDKYVAPPPVVHPNALALSGDASGPHNFIDILNFVASYGDLITAFGTNQQAAQNWYNTQEPIENRVETFDGLDYVASYGDLINAFKSAGSEHAVLDAGATHFITNGSKEGRTTTFNGLDYIASYGDLIKAFGANGDAGAYHYIENGRSEGRTTTFDGLDYIASYSDLIKALGANEQAGAAHFIDYGSKEGRTTTFDGLAYIANYTDLMNAFGANNDAGATHYITNGFSEHRTTTFNVAAYESAHPDLLNKFSSNDAFLTAYITDYRATGKFLT